MITPMNPGVYALKHHEKTGYYMEFTRPRFDVSGKNYGKMDYHVNLVWSRFQSRQSSMGVMLTGAAGSGKTRVSELISNIAISSNMCVLMVTDVHVSIALIPFVASLHNMVIVFDEFAKNIPAPLQNKMLTMFSAVGPLKKLFIITENDRRTVSQFIRTRPGRVRYALDYDRIEKEVIDEYCADYNVAPAMKEEFLEIYGQATAFTFDHLAALVSEHLAMPEASIDELMEVLNLDDLVKPPTWECVSCKREDSPDIEYTTTGGSFTKDTLTRSRVLCWVELGWIIKEGEVTASRRDTVRIEAKDIDRIEEDDTYVFVRDGYTLEFVKRI